MPGLEQAQLPNFFILGVAKCGTTTLHNILRQHPEIFMTKMKEPQFFDNEERYSKGYKDYLNVYFSGSEDYLIRGESTPGYFCRPDVVAPRMVKDLDAGNLKFVVLVRDPVARAHSHYLHRLKTAAETHSFEDALEVEPQLLASNPELWAGYFHDGLYGEFASRWFHYFAREKFLFIVAEELATNRIGALTRICKHLGVDPEFQWKEQRSLNKAGVPRSRLIMEVLVRPPNIVKRVIKASGSEHLMLFSRRIRQLVRRLNTREIRPPKLDERMVMNLRRKYHEDMVLFGQLTGVDVSPWLLDPSKHDRSS